MALDFRSLIFEGMARIPSYSTWLLECDMDAGLPLPPAGAEAPPVALPARAVVAQIACAHAVDRRARRRVPRCPVRDDPSRRRQVLPSVCALYDTFAVLTDRPDPVAIGARNVELWRRRSSAWSRSATGATRNASTTSPSRPCSATRWANGGPVRRARRRAQPTRPAERMDHGGPSSSRTARVRTAHDPADLRPRPRRRPRAVRLLRRALRRPRRGPAKSTIEGST